MATALPRIDATFTLGDLARVTGATLLGQSLQQPGDAVRDAADRS